MVPDLRPSSPFRTGPILLFGVLADRMAGQAFAERLLAGGEILGVRQYPIAATSAAAAMTDNLHHVVLLSTDERRLPHWISRVVQSSRQVSKFGNAVREIQEPSMSVRHARARPGCAGPPRGDRGGAARDRAGRGRDRGRARDAAVRIRRAHRLSAIADGGGAAGDHRSRSRTCCAIATKTASRWCRAAPAPRCPAARCRWTTASCSAWRSSTASARSITTTAWRWSSPASPISRISNAVAHAGFYYAPDPSSQIACTIGGNVAENSGGVHCLKYGMTTNNVLGLEMVLIDRRGHPHRRQASRFRRL